MGKRITTKIYTVLLIAMTCVFLCMGCGNNKVTMENEKEDVFYEIFRFNLPESATYEALHQNQKNNFQVKIKIDAQCFNEVYKSFDEFYCGKMVRKEEFDADVDKSYYGSREFNWLKQKAEWIDIAYEDVEICFYQPSFGHIEPNLDRDQSVSYWTLIQTNDDQTVTIYVVVG